MPTCHWLQKTIHHASVLNSDENQLWHHKFALQKANLHQEFVLNPTPAFYCNSTFSLPFFNGLQVDTETHTDVSLHPNQWLGFAFLRLPA